MYSPCSKTFSFVLQSRSSVKVKFKVTFLKKMAYAVEGGIQFSDLRTLKESEKQKMMVNSINSSSHNVLYPIKDRLFIILATFYFWSGTDKRLIYFGII